MHERGTRDADQAAGLRRIFGVAPAIRASRPDVMKILRASGRASGLGGRLLRNTVVVVEVALSFVLLIGSGLMFRSFLALQRIDPGFDPHGVLTFLLVGGRPGSTPPQRAAFMRERLDRLRALPGLRSVTASTPLPLTDGSFTLRWGTEPALTDPSKFQAVDYQTVLPGYFETVRTPLLAGCVAHLQLRSPLVRLLLWLFGPGPVLGVVEPEAAARKITSAILGRRRVLAFPLSTRLLTRLGQRLPAAVYDWLMLRVAARIPLADKPPPEQPAPQPLASNYVS